MKQASNNAFVFRDNLFGYCKTALKMQRAQTAREVIYSPLTTLLSTLFNTSFFMSLISAFLESCFTQQTLLHGKIQEFELNFSIVFSKTDGSLYIKRSLQCENNLPQRKSKVIKVFGYLAFTHGHTHVQLTKCFLQKNTRTFSRKESNRIYTLEFAFTWVSGHFIFLVDQSLFVLQRARHFRFDKHSSAQPFFRICIALCVPFWKSDYNRVIPTYAFHSCFESQRVKIWFKKKGPPTISTLVI